MVMKEIVSMEVKGQSGAAPVASSLLFLQYLEPFYVFYVSPMPRCEIAWGSYIGLGIWLNRIERFGVSGCQEFWCSENRNRSVIGITDNRGIWGIKTLVRSRLWPIDWKKVETNCAAAVPLRSELRKVAGSRNKVKYKKELVFRFLTDDDRSSDWKFQFRYIRSRARFFRSGISVIGLYIHP
jgi:hypothetical protein